MSPSNSSLSRLPVIFDPRYSTLTNPIILSYKTLSSRIQVNLKPHFISNGFSINITLSFIPIKHVVCNGTREQVIKLKARFIITRVPNNKISSRAMLQFPSNKMNSHNSLLSGKTHYPVPIRGVHHIFKTTIGHSFATRIKSLSRNLWVFHACHDTRLIGGQ